MTTHISTGVLVSVLILLQSFASEGAVGTECSTKDECGKNEDCGIGGVCECDPGYNIVEGGCFNECPALDDPADGTVEVRPNTETTEYDAIYACINGFEIQGPSRRRCLNDSTWEGSAPTCKKIACPSLAPPLNGRVSLSDNIGEFGSTASYTCNQGFEITSGDAVRECQSSKEWTGIQPVCSGIVDPCVPNPCPTPTDATQLDCVANLEDDKQHVCICPIGKKGANCDEEDPPITCRGTRKKFIYFDSSPTLSDRTVCLPKKNSTSENVCYNPNEDITYRFDGANDISVDDTGPGKFCLTYTNAAPTIPEDCVNIKAFEADDIDYRPWINETFQLCFIFNRHPKISPLNKTLTYNVVTMPDTVNVPIQASDIDNQTLTLTISNVGRIDFEDKFSIADDNLVISNPIQLYESNPGIFGDIFTVQIKATDNGIPQLDDRSDINVKFVYEQLECTVPEDVFMVHLDPVPTDRVKLGQIVCTAAGSSVTPVFEITNEGGPVVIEADGAIFYNPATTGAEGRFRINVRADVTVSVPISSAFHFVVFAADFNPRCTQSDLQRPVEVSEKADTGTCSDVTFTCDDRANITKTCTDTSDLFDVLCEMVSSNITNVKVCTAVSLDQKAGKEEKVSIEVQNAYGVHNIDVTVSITNVNDPPSFVTDVKTKNIEISEESTPPMALTDAVFPVADPDISIDLNLDNLTASIKDIDAIETADALPFTASVNSFKNAVSVTLSQDLRPKQRHNYLLELKVEDSAGESDTVNLNITVTDINEKPKCTQSAINTSATVRDPVDYVVTILPCTDDDFSQSYNTLSYSLEGDVNTLAYFQIDSNGEVKLKQELTLFTSGTELTFTARVNDGGGLSEVVQIRVNVITSYPPECEKYEVIQNVSEISGLDYCFEVIVNCNDPVKSETLLFKEPSGNGTQLFTLNSDATNNDKISFCTRERLKGKVGQWHLNLEVQSSYGPRNIQIIVSVQDENDAPECAPSKMDIKASATDSADTILDNIICTDKDTDANFKTLTYTLEGQSDVISYFNMNAGEIKLAKALSDITGTNNILSFTVRVEDGGGLSVTVTVTVTVKTDFPPSCNMTDFEIAISEATDKDVCRLKEIGCQDIVRGESLQYNITSGNGTALFYEKDSTNFNLNLCTQTSLQGKYGPWKIVVVVKSSHGETTLNCIVRVADKNDPPEFSETLYSYKVPESATINTVVTTLLATDQDSGAFGKLTYLSKDIEESGLFTLNKDNGEIRIISSLDADGSDSNSYTYIVQAVDGASVPLSATASVQIDIIDVNDEKPVCSPTDATDSIQLLTAIGTVIRQLDCSDADMSPSFRVLEYSTTSSYFSVNSTGYVTLSSKLPRDVTQHEVNVKVTDSDKSSDPDFSTHVIITVQVDNKVSPVCTPEKVEAALDETKSVGICVETDIICTDPTEGDVTLESQSGSGAENNLFEIKPNKETGKLTLSACIKSSLKNKFGEYILIGSVTNGLASTTVSFHNTVRNVNEPPVFTPDSYSIDVSENFELNKEILKISVSDPDDGMGDPSYELDDITVEASNNADFGGALSDSILFLKAVKTFYAYRKFNATVRNIYKYTVTAVDKSGLKTTTTVTINILDENSAPFCDPSQYAATIDILAEQNKVVLMLQCYDTDIDPDNVKLEYKIVGGDSDGYFDVTEDGKLIVQKPLPRDDLIYNVGKADIQVQVSDTGTPPLSTSITATVDVLRNISATCKPVIIPPDVWIQGNCVTIKMDCTDPTKTGIDHLQYTLMKDSNYTTGFNLKSNSQGTIELCYTLLVSGVFEVKVEVNNGLGIYKWTDNIVVSYAKATPIFTESKYTETIPETTVTGTEVVMVEAKQNQLIGKVQYNVLGDASTKGWETYFSLDSNTGKITTVIGIKTLADSVITLKVEAVDTVSQLRSSVLVELTVVDLNERPTCTISSTNLDIQVGAAVDTHVIEFACSDPDVKKEYSTLSYDISGSDVDVYFKFVGDPTTSVAIKTPLNILTFKYVISLTVSDQGTPPLLFSQDFTVNVNLLPPAVDVVATALSFDTIRVTWDYARPDFYDVTNGFKVKALTLANIIAKESPELDSSTRTYEISGLSAKTQYIIVVEAITDAGRRSSQGQPVTTQEIPVLTHFTAIFVAYKDYNDRLRDVLSQIYYEYKRDVSESVSYVLKDTAGFAGIRDVSFRRHNSIYVDIQASVNQSGNVDYTIEKLEEAVSTGKLNQMSVQKDFFQAAVGAGFISIDALTYRPTEVYNGSEIVLSCNITAVGYSEDEQFDFWWTYRGNRLYPNDQSRYSVSTSADEVFNEYKRSTLRVNPIQGDMSGFYGCHVSDAAGEQVKDKSIELTVISQPTVFITPKSLTVKYGETVNVTCGLIEIPGTFERFIWYRNGEPFLKEANEVISESSALMTITVKGIRVNVVFGCEAKNEAGSSARVFSYIGVIPQDAKTDDLCPEVQDYRGTTWPQSAPGIVVRLNCNDTQSYSGEIYRGCSATGVWNPPVYECVSTELSTIEQQLKDIQDGFKPLNLTEVLVDLNKATTDNSLYIGDIDSTLTSLDIAVGIDDNATSNEKVTRKDNILKICSSLIAQQNREPWFSSIEVRRKGAISIPRLVEQSNTKSMDGVLDNKEIILSVPNIHITIGAGKRDVYTFPDKSNTAPDWVKSTKTSIVIQGEAFKDIQNVHYASSYFRNITPILVKSLKKDGRVTDVSSSYDINAPIVSFQLKESLSKVDPPAEITFEHFDSNYSNPICCYWDFQEEAFLTDGCTLVSSDDDVTVCQCNHFTNFAVLMSPGKTPPADVLALSIISAVGCGISIICLLLTVILHFIVWRFVKSDRAVLLLNLCAALIISYIVFLAGVDRVENKDVCTAVSALLHYFYLVVFFLMLAYGIEIAISVVYVFVTRSRIKWLLPLAWGIPLVIVGISMGVTKLEGYGNESFCWLSIEDGLLWAFVGPAALIIVINFIIVVIVLRQMFKSSAMMTKSDKEKAVMGVRSICVLLPILGLTWVFGIFSVNEDLVVFQYIFAICNSLQGFLIFLFHCILNKQLRQAIKQRSDRKKSLQSIENTFKNPHSTTGSTAFLSNENKLQQNKDLNTGSTNPFLEADRQMKELVGKNKKSTNLNDNFEANNKVEVDNRSKAVDLDDVKISNIIRESEVMGGTAGISSILPADNRTEDDKINETPMSRSQISSGSHRYDYIDPREDPGKNSPPQTVGIEKPPGYEKLLQATGLANYASKDSVHSGSDRSREKEKQREKEREKERERERERQRKIEKEKLDRIEKEKKERERMERENEERERKEREQRDKSKYHEGGVIRIGYTNEGYNTSATVDRRREGSQERRSQPRSGRSSRTDDDYEARLYERHIRMHRVYLPRRQLSGSSAQNVTSINTALPEKFEFYQGKKRQQKEAKKHSESSLKKKDKKKSSLKDRSKAYEYSYESTYLGGNSRHASLENMNMQNLGYSPYAQMPGYGGYPTGRPAVQQQHWDQYAGYARGPREPRTPRDPRDYDPYARDPYRRDYW